jgi:hypothetical protein
VAKTKTYRIDIYQTVNYLYEEFVSETEAREFAAKLRSEMAQKAQKDWQEFHFGIEEIESADE